MISEFEIFPLKWTKKARAKKISYQAVSFSILTPGGTVKYKNGIEFDLQSI